MLSPPFPNIIKEAVITNNPEKKKDATQKTIFIEKNNENNTKNVAKQQ